MTKLLVYESVPRTAALLARLGTAQLREVRSLMQLKKVMEDGPADIVAIEVTESSNLPAVAQLIRWMKAKWEPAVIAMPSHAEHRDQTENVTDESASSNRAAYAHAVNSCLYESGADVIFRTMLDRELARKLILRAVNRRSSSPRQTSTFREQVFAALPWKRFSTR